MKAIHAKVQTFQIKRMGPCAWSQPAHPLARLAPQLWLQESCIHKGLQPSADAIFRNTASHSFTSVAEFGGGLLFFHTLVVGLRGQDTQDMPPACHGGAGETAHPPSLALLLAGGWGTVFQHPQSWTLGQTGLNWTLGRVGVSEGAGRGGAEAGGPEPGAGRGQDTTSFTVLCHLERLLAD